MAVARSQRPRSTGLRRRATAYQGMWNPRHGRDRGNQSVRGLEDELQPPQGACEELEPLQRRREHCWYGGCSNVGFRGGIPSSCDALRSGAAADGCSVLKAFSVSCSIWSRCSGVLLVTLA